MSGNITRLAGALALIIASGALAFAGERVEVGHGEYKQNFERGGESNFTVGKGETHIIEMEREDVLTRHDPDTGEVTWHKLKND